MYIPVVAIVVILIIYFHHQDKLNDEISSLRDDIRDLDSNRDHFNYYEEAPNVEDKQKEYTFQESQDRSILEVKYDASEEEIRSAYVELRKKYNPHISSENMQKFKEIQLAYKRLIKKT